MEGPAKTPIAKPQIGEERLSLLPRPGAPTGTAKDRTRRIESSFAAILGASRLNRGRACAPVISTELRNTEHGEDQ